MGKAQPGDKTRADALIPAIDALETAAKEGSSLKDGLAKALAMAEKGMKDTIPLVAKGRASYLGERPAGHQDPGATSSYLILKAFMRLWRIEVMIGILVVCHSAKAAKGIAEIASQMAGEKVKVVGVGGNEEGGIGTLLLIFTPC